ncbi:hypothetical protein TrST_g8275 [Triparma strigata]|uniref:Plasma membrane ATPase n=1 Tax=Triparma strigata TaxID=1606541 RepID=A0A9W7DX08_9STRA|nr:hypothetical protein TrST_g8275 [Triparma strigata]
MAPSDNPPLPPSNDLTASLLRQSATADPMDRQSMTALAPVGTGLTTQEAARRLDFFGPNCLEEKKTNALLKFLGYFWGPMPIMIWLASLIELINESIPDLCVLLLLQLINGLVGYVEEKNAGNAIDALKASLTPKCTVKRDGRWQGLDAKNLVPGDVINLKLGDIIPADCRLAEGQPVSVDQAALTGESLPVTLYPGDSGKMGATVKRGEIEAHVTATGSNTFFGKAAAMVNSVENVSRFQKILFKIAMSLLCVAVVITTTIMIVLLNEGVNILRALAICVVLLVASIPIAMQVVSTSTMAVGARRLADMGVIVARLGAIEEMAGMDMLCSDKTGTLTQNKLKLYEPIIVSNVTSKELVFYAALAAKRMEEGQDAIDFCITRDCESDAEFAKKLDEYEELEFIPFDPTSKKTVATVKNITSQKVFKTCKGMCNIVLDMCDPDDATRIKVVGAVQELADRGYRALGVAKTNDSGKWEFLGVLSLFDPPREDTKETIAKAMSMGIQVKMVTGDQTAIAKETCRSLGMGAGILNSDVFHHSEGEIEARGQSLHDIVKDAHGFAEVYPEHKFKIVKMLMDSGFTCGMTGDGVNDAPALKRAQIGIAVEGATDAARAAADIVLTDPGLKTIIDAILRARKIFARVRNYCIYRISATFQLIFFFFFAVVGFKSTVQNQFPDQMRSVAASKTMFGEMPQEFETVFTLPVMALVAITLLNDGLIISICKDKVVAAAKPQKWFLKEIFAVAIALGFCLIVENCTLLLVGMNAGPGAEASPDACGQNPIYYDSNDSVGTAKCTSFVHHWLGDDTYGTITYRELKTVIYLSLSLSGFMTVLAARTKGFWFSRRMGYLLMSATIVAFIVTTILALNVSNISTDLDMDNLRGRQVAFVWCWVLISFTIQDMIVKRAVYAAYDWYKNDSELKNGEDYMHAIVSNQIEEERLTMRRTSLHGASGRNTVGSAHGHGDFGAGPSRPSVGFDRLSRMSGERKSPSELLLEKKLLRLEEELSLLKEEVSRKKDKKK